MRTEIRDRTNLFHLEGACLSRGSNAIFVSVDRVINLLRKQFPEKDPMNAPDGVAGFECCMYWERTKQALEQEDMDRSSIDFIYTKHFASANAYPLWGATKAVVAHIGYMCFHRLGCKKREKTYSRFWPYPISLLPCVGMRWQEQNRFRLYIFDWLVGSKPRRIISADGSALSR